jgi:hypothetical protein
MNYGICVMKWIFFKSYSIFRELGMVIGFRRNGSDESSEPKDRLHVEKPTLVLKFGFTTAALLF